MSWFRACVDRLWNVCVSIAVCVLYMHEHSCNLSGQIPSVPTAPLTYCENVACSSVSLATTVLHREESFCIIDLGVLQQLASLSPIPPALWIYSLTAIEGILKKERH